MKKLFFISMLVLSTYIMMAQNCTTQAHAPNEQDSWLSCATNTSHWIMYDLGYVYGIGTSHFWNYNVTGETDKGFRNTQIEYSIDGSNWSSLPTFTLAQASGTRQYEGVMGPDFEGKAARYIRLSALDTWGDGQCAGLSEVRFDIVKKITTSMDIPRSLPVEMKVYPNPVGQRLQVDWSNDLVIKEMVIINMAGHEVSRFSNTRQQDVSHLPSGVYLLQVLGKDGEVWTKKFIKE